MSESKEPKELTLLPSITSLLKPTANYLGEEIKDAVKEIVENRKKKKEDENLLSHLNLINEKINSSNEKSVSYEQLDLFSEWVDEVSKIDPKNEELSQLWQNLLLNASADNSSEILISKIRKMSSGEAKALVALSNPTRKKLSEEERYHLKSLEDLELIESNSTFINLFKFIIGGFFLGFGYLALKFIVIDGLFTSISSKQGLDITKVLFFLIPFIVFFSGTLGTINSLQKRGIWAKKAKQLTWIGKELVGLKRDNKNG